MRKSRVERTTKETSVEVVLNIDGSGRAAVDTTIPFLDHLISSIAKHGMMDLRIAAKSKDGIVHHIAEDVAITFASALDKALGKRERITRFGHAIVPMDDAVAFAALDLVRREYYNIDLKLERTHIEGMPREDLEHFYRSFAQKINACTHVVVQYGRNDHHKIEAATKALAVALRQAASIDRRGRGVPTTKGRM